MLLNEHLYWKLKYFHIINNNNAQSQKNTLKGGDI